MGIAMKSVDERKNADALNALNAKHEFVTADRRPVKRSVKSGSTLRTGCAALLRFTPLHALYCP